MKISLLDLGGGQLCHNFGAMGHYLVISHFGKTHHGLGVTIVKFKVVRNSCWEFASAWLH